MDGQPAFRFIPATGPAALIAEGVWSLCLPGGGPAVETIAPDGRCEIVVHLDAPPAARSGSSFDTQPEAFLYGPLDRALILQRQAGLNMRAIRLTPWGVGMLTRGARAMTGLAVQLRDALGDTGARLEEAARQAGTLEAFAAAAFALLAGHAARKEHFPDRGLMRMIDALSSGPVPLPGDLLEASGLARRTFERRFAAITGMAPGQWLRIGRFQQARAAVASSLAPLAEIALDAGYADQAHMTRDFQRYEAISPAALRQTQGGFAPIYALSPDIG